MNGTYQGTLVGYPTPPYIVQFAVNGVTMIQQSVIGSPNVISLTSPDLLTNGTFSYNDNSYFLIFTDVTSGTVVTTSFEPSSTEVVRANPENCDTPGYQRRPEDCLDTPVEDMADEYPWRRDLVGGGELIDFDTYSPAQPDIKTVVVGQTTAVTSQSGAQYDVQVIVPGPYPPRFTLSERSLDNYVPGQQAIAFTGTFLNLAGDRPTTGTLAGGLDGVLEPGWQLYHFGLVQGVLVADAPKFFGVHHREGLALWFPLNEHERDAIQVLDHSVYNSKAFIEGIHPEDRKFDPVRGQFLSARPGMVATSPVYRGFNQKFSGGFWIRAVYDYTEEQAILLSGPLKITLSGVIPTPQLKFYLRDTTGTYTLQGTQSFDQQWVYFAWNYDGQQHFTVHFWTNAGVLTTQTFTVGFNIDFETTYSFTLSCPEVSFDVQDVRLWNTTKTVDQLRLARYHDPTPTACLYRPTWLQSVNTYDHYAVKVLPSGYLVPEQLPTSIITNKLAWVQRYDYLARYSAQDRYKETGIGSGNALPPVQYLGAQWDTLTADGTVAVSSWEGNSLGINNAWLFDNPAGSVLTLVESGSTIIGIPGTLIPTGTNSPWPNPLIATNPCRDQIWVKGDDGFMWRVSLGSDEHGNTGFLTEKLFSLSGSYQPTGAQVALTDASNGNQLAVNTSGTVYAGTYSGTVTSSPIYLYCNEETVVSLSGTEAVSAWVQPNAFGLGQNPPVAALTKNGRIDFEITDTMQPGFYRLSVTSGNIGKVDNYFAGFNVVITVGDVSFQGKLCATSSGADFETVNTFEFYLSHTLPGNPSSWLLSFDWSNALRDQQKGTMRQLYIRSVELVRFSTTLYMLSMGPSSVDMTPFGTASSDYPSTPGGWLAKISSWGSVYEYVHESQVYSSNDTVQNPQPLSNKLTATTLYRREDILLNGSFTIPDPAIPPFEAYDDVTSTCDDEDCVTPESYPSVVLPFNSSRLLGIHPDSETLWIGGESNISVRIYNLADLTLNRTIDVSGIGVTGRWFYDPVNDCMGICGVNYGLVIIDPSTDSVTPVNSLAFGNLMLAFDHTRGYYLGPASSSDLARLVDGADGSTIATGAFTLDNRAVYAPEQDCYYYSPGFATTLTKINPITLATSTVEVFPDAWLMDDGWYVPELGLLYLSIDTGSGYEVVIFDPATETLGPVLHGDHNPPAGIEQLTYDSCANVIRVTDFFSMYSYDPLTGEELSYEEIDYLSGIIFSKPHNLTYYEDNMGFSSNSVIRTIQP
jgi:hypothetical protein